jgi:hypothetical protein
MSLKIVLICHKQWLDSNIFGVYANTLHGQSKEIICHLSHNVRISDILWHILRGQILSEGIHAHSTLDYAAWKLETDFFKSFFLKGLVQFWNRKEHFKTSVFTTYIYVIKCILRLKLSQNIIIKDDVFLVSFSHFL